MSDFESRKKQWLKKANNCKATRGKHTWIISSWTVSDRSKHAAMLLCNSCLKSVNLEDCHKYAEDHEEEAEVISSQESPNIFE